MKHNTNFMPHPEGEGNTTYYHNNSSPCRQDVFNDLLWRVTKAGFRIFPCRPGDKAPLTRNGFKAATTVWETVIRWLEKHSNANWAVVTGPVEDGDEDRRPGNFVA